MKFWTLLLVGILTVGMAGTIGCEENLEKVFGESNKEDHSTGEFSTLAKISSFHDTRPDEHDIIVIWKMDNGKDLALTEKTVYWIDAPSCSSRFLGDISEFNQGDIIEYMWDTDDLIVNIHGARIYPTDVVKSCKNYKSEPEPEPDPCPCCGEPCNNSCGCDVPDCGYP